NPTSVVTFRLLGVHQKFTSLSSSCNTPQIKRVRDCIKEESSSDTTHRAASVSRSDHPNSGADHLKRSGGYFPLPHVLQVVQRVQQAPPRDPIQLSIHREWGRHPTGACKHS